MSGAILGEAAELSCQSAAPLLHGFNQQASHMRTPAVLAHSSLRRRTPIHSSARISHIALLYYLLFFGIVTGLQFVSEEKETFGWLYLILLQYHTPQYYSYHTASTILAGSGAVHSTQCSAHPWHKAWERSVTLPDAAITVHKPRRGPTDATCGDHKTGSKAAVRHATRRPGLQILSHSTPSATGSQT